MKVSSRLGDDMHPNASLAPSTSLNTTHQSPTSPRSRATENLNTREGIVYAKALWDNKADTQDELTFHENDVIRVLATDPSGWWKGEVQGKTGYFPGNRVIILR